MNQYSLGGATIADPKTMMEIEKSNGSPALPLKTTAEIAHNIWHAGRSWLDIKEVEIENLQHFQKLKMSLWKQQLKLQKKLRKTSVFHTPVARR